MNGEHGYSPWGAYCQGKLANLMLAFELHRRLQDAGIAASSMAVHPAHMAANLQFAGLAMKSTVVAGLSGPLVGLMLLPQQPQPVRKRVNSKA